MEINYDSGVDAMRIKFQDGEYEISEEIGDGIIIDMTRKGKIMAIEIFDVSDRMPEETLKSIIVDIPRKASIKNT